MKHEIERPDFGKSAASLRLFGKTLNLGFESVSNYGWSVPEDGVVVGVDAMFIEAGMQNCAILSLRSKALSVFNR